MQEGHGFESCRGNYYNSRRHHGAGAPNKKILAKYLNIIFCFFRLFRSFLKLCLCKVIQIDLFGVFSRKFSPPKILGNRILSTEFPSC